MRAASSVYGVYRVVREFLCFLCEFYRVVEVLVVKGFPRVIEPIFSIPKQVFRLIDVFPVVIRFRYLVLRVVYRSFRVIERIFRILFLGIVIRRVVYLIERVVCGLFCEFRLVACFVIVSVEEREQG